MLAKLRFFFFFFFVDGVLGCLPDAGKVYTSPSFSFDVQPPLRWSFGDAAGPAFPGQPRSKEDAQANFKDDLELAVMRALNAEKIPPAYASSCNGILSKDNKTIIGICTNPPSPPAYSVQGTLGVKSTTGLSESTWKTLAANVQKELAKMGAIFVKPITVKI
ncbi:unnamed protein product, partial [Mesorhabditis belari]|uniref:Uncharacterized protein n=1 Tax=Mesorhabditis belari TaxID=2138241 RepID=A0AAF3J6Z9_9BILA